MSLFIGDAWFSPCVPEYVRKDWSTHGGHLMKDTLCAARTVYLFCDGNDDPWFRKLYRRSLAVSVISTCLRQTYSLKQVFHWTWIPAVIDAQMRLPIAPYAIHGRALSRPDEPPAPEYSSMILQNAPSAYRCSPAKSLGHTIRQGPYKRSSRAVRSSGVSVSPSNNLVRTPSPSWSKDSVPFIDLRKEAGREVLTSRRPTPIRIVGYNLEPRGAPRNVIKSGTENQDNVAFRGLMSAASSGQAVSVSVALESLRPLPTGQATLFVPGTLHLGREFRCFYAQ
ncbi:hypothetical protein C8Q78DRAFT_1042833 [Trametes maxima]|nr:hypothetical protein C8Q78DRAFT_1042833 [Trametes maxima]